MCISHLVTSFCKQTPATLEPQQNFINTTPPSWFPPSCQYTKYPLCAVWLKSYLSVGIQLPTKHQLLDCKHYIFSHSLSIVKSNRGQCPLSVLPESSQVKTRMKCHKIFVLGWRLLVIYKLLWSSIHKQGEKQSILWISS
jgi:hypothetical protein